MSYIQCIHVYTQNITKLYKTIQMKTNDVYIRTFWSSRAYDGDSISHHAYGEIAVRIKNNLNEKINTL